MQPALKFFNSSKVFGGLHWRNPLRHMRSGRNLRETKEGPRAVILFGPAGAIYRLQPDISKPPLNNPQNSGALTPVFGFDCRLQFILPFLLQIFFSILVPL